MPHPLRGRYGPHANRWSGGRYQAPDGYVYVTLGPDHPHYGMAHRRGGSRVVREHRLVMAQHLGRDLGRREIVHHHDHDRGNNDISNLVLYANHAAHMTAEHN